jgi:hypothetical protein
VFVALVAVLALGAVAASAAQAEAEGPFWRVPCHKVSTENKGKGAFGEEACKSTSGLKEWTTRLLAGEESELTAKAAKGFVLSRVGIYITCNSFTSISAEVIGSTGANAGTRHEKDGVGVLKECKLTGNGINCKLSSPEIRLASVIYQFGYGQFGQESKKRGGKLLVLLTPTFGTFARIYAEGACTVPVMELSGSAAAEVRSGGKAVEVGAEPAQTKVVEFTFPKPPITSIWTEKEGVVTEHKPKIIFIDGAGALYGTEESELVSKEPFGVFTK